jgi:hypothetical protein
VDPSRLEATAVYWQGGETILKVSWNDASPNLPYSTFSPEFLERYAPVVAKQVGGSSETPGDETWNTELDIPSWFEPYSGYPDAPAPTEY